MSIAIKIPKAVKIRRLFDTGLDAEDIAKLTGYPLTQVREAIAAGEKGSAIRK